MNPMNRTDQTESGSKRLQQLALPAGIGILILAIFLIDTNMALGFTPWLLYVIPLGLTYWTSTRSAPLAVAALCAFLMVAGYALSPPLAPERLVFTNRLIGVGTFCGLAWLIMRYQVLVRRLSHLTEELKRELTERTQDLGRAVSAIRAVEEEGKRAEDRPLADQQFKRQVTDVLQAERRRLEEKVVHLVRKEPSPRPRKESLDATLEELERLGKQLEQWQRDLLRP
jgi:hypothetical protein